MTSDITASLDENIRIAQALVRTLAEQDQAVKLAFARGWTECGRALAYESAAAWETGYDAAKADQATEWEDLSSWIRHRHGSPASTTFRERRDAEVAALASRPDDFPGIEQDPQCIARCRASVEAITHNKRRAA